MTNAQLLSQVPLFAGLSPGEMEALAGTPRRRRYPKGDTIFHQDDPGSSLYVVAEGQVKIGLTSAEGKQITLALLGRGDFFGELSLLDGQPRSADAVAAEACELLALHRQDFLGFLRSHHEACASLLAALSQRLRRTNEQLQDAAFLDVSSRLAKVLLDLAQNQGEPTSVGTSIAMRLTQAELAALVGATRESINKWMGFYERQGLVRYQGGRITVLNPQKLRQRIS